MKEKAKQLFDLVNVDAVLLENQEEIKELNLYYFTGLPKKITGHQYLVLTRDKATLYATVLEYGAIEKELKHKFIDLQLFKSEKTLLAQLAQEFQDAEVLGLNYPLLSKRSYDKLSDAFGGKLMADVSNSLNKLREKKTPQEIEFIQKACKVSEGILKEIPRLAKPGRTETQVRIAMDSLMYGQDCVPAFETIVATGSNGSVPHHVAGNTKLKKGDLLLLDFGAEYANYASDITRMFTLGKASKHQKEMYALVHEAKERSHAQAYAGNTAKELFLASENFLKEHGYPMIHSIGHGLGLRVHDFPTRMGADAEWKLEEGMVITIEPGAYDPKWGGIRIEDDVLIEGNRKHKRLTKAPKQLVEL